MDDVSQLGGATVIEQSNRAELSDTEVAERKREARRRQNRIGELIAIVVGTPVVATVAALACCGIGMQPTAEPTRTMLEKPSQAVLSGEAIRAVSEEAHAYKIPVLNTESELFDEARRFHNWVHRIEQNSTFALAVDVAAAQQIVAEVQERSFPVLRDRLGPIARAHDEPTCRTSGPGYRTLRVGGGRNMRHALANVWGSRRWATDPWEGNYRHWANCLRFRTVVVAPRSGGVFSITKSAPEDRELLSDCRDDIGRSNLREHLYLQGSVDSQGRWRWD